MKQTNKKIFAIGIIAFIVGVMCQMIFQSRSGTVEIPIEYFYILLCLLLTLGILTYVRMPLVIPVQIRLNELPEETIAETLDLWTAQDLIRSDKIERTIPPKISGSTTKSSTVKQPEQDDTELIWIESNFV